MTDIDWSQYGDDDLARFPLEIWNEQQRRHVLSTAQDNIRSENVKYLEAAGRHPGEGWVQPTGAHDSYPKDWTVTHHDKTWASLSYGNVTEPGVSGWHEVVTEENSCPDFIPPTGAHDVYMRDDCVTFEGNRYVSLIDNNSWSPADYPAGWALQA